MAAPKPYRPMSKTTPTEPVEVELVFRQTIGRVYSAAEALSLIGSNWDSRPVEVNGVDGQYEFQIDDHLFTVTVAPLDSLPKVPTPFDSPVLRADGWCGCNQPDCLKCNPVGA